MAAVATEPMYKTKIAAFDNKFLFADAYGRSLFAMGTHGRRSSTGHLLSCADTTKMYPAREWEPYIRVMPHGEFPSGSACLCSAASAITAAVYKKPYEAPSLNLSVTFNKNKVESRLNGQGYTQFYSNLKEYADDCTYSRFRGGMHFNFSLEPGIAMCTTANQFTEKA
eukprot:gene27971-8853_t